MQEKKPLSHGNMPVWTTKVVLSHPQTSQELFQFHAQNNTEKQPQRFSHATMKWTRWSKRVVWTSTGKKSVSSIFISQHTIHQHHPLTQWHHRSLELLNGSSDQDWWFCSSVSTIHPHSLPSVQLGWVIGCRWGGDHCWAECGNTSNVYGTDGEEGKRILPVVSSWCSEESFFQKRSHSPWLLNRVLVVLP